MSPRAARHVLASLTLLALLDHPTCVGACRVDLYEHVNLQGEKYTTHCNGCVTLPPHYQNWPSSLSAHDSGCLRLYESVNCNTQNGSSEAQNFYPGGTCGYKNNRKACYADLSEPIPSGVFWNDRVRSIGRC